MRNPQREANDRKLYVNLDADVEIHYCVKGDPMPAEVGDRAEELKQLWIHDDVEETEESKIADGSVMWFHCPNCEHNYSVFVGD